MEKARLRRARLVVSTPDSRIVNVLLMDFIDAVDVILRTMHLRSAQRYLEREAYYVSVTALLAAEWLAVSLAAGRWNDSSRCRHR